MCMHNYPDQSTSTNAVCAIPTSQYRPLCALVTLSPLLLFYILATSAVELAIVSLPNIGDHEGVSVVLVSLICALLCSALLCCAVHSIAKLGRLCTVL